ncbi:MAG: NADH-quinone oxidoreductase subunit H [Deltaproteobacteria bacterium]|jgi:formate hydrogenlyase subunit 4|nr:NADH-quinone oxidoreductase subunit H [Deltaproteobacteria bacterium]
MTEAILHIFLALLLAPLLPGVISRVKASLAGRNGKPLFQLYFDLARLLRKGAVYSHTTSWVFRAGPMLGLAAMLAALCLLPAAGGSALFSFKGDFILAAYLLAMSRFAIILAALDTGSAFEGMGASREAAFSALAEPVFLLSLLPLGMIGGSYSLSSMLLPDAWNVPPLDRPVLLLLSASLFLVLLTENSRIPVDDPNTHLELTMIHEVMVLDHSGVDLAFIEYSAALKLWFFSVVVGSLLLPPIWSSYLIVLLSVFSMAVAVGLVESIMARLRLVRVPQLLSLAFGLAALACLLCLR